ncbi:MAG: hypothetical protein GY864_03135, partial [Desulfobacterales bacterium]|nr:hypothetical protein [Desulfobacterales bacterium]
QREQAICEQVLENVKVLIGSKVDRLSNLADAMKFDNRLYRVFTSPNMSSSDLKDVGQTIQAQIDLPILEITDRKGSILYSAEPGRQVGGFSDLWGIDEALDGESPVIASRLDKDWVIRQFVPLKWGNDFYGTLHLGFKLNNEFIEQLSDVTNAQLSITSLERVVAGIEDFDGLSREELFQSEFWNWLTEENVPLFMENSAKKHFTMYAAVRMVDETFCLILRMDTTDVYELLNEKTKDFKIAFLIILLAMLVCCLLLTLYISRPLKRL